jgi:hypothetical protein
VVTQTHTHTHTDMNNAAHPFGLTFNGRYTPKRCCAVCSTDAMGNDKPNCNWQSIPLGEWAAHAASRGHLRRLQSRDLVRVLAGQPIQQEGIGTWRYQCLLCALTPEGTPRGPTRLRHHEMQRDQLVDHCLSRAHLDRDDGRVQMYHGGPQPLSPLFAPHVLPGYVGAQVIFNLPAPM